VEILIPTTRYTKDIKRARKRGWNLVKLQVILQMIEAEKPLPMSAKNHRLQGEYAGYWECYIAPNWLLVYKVFGDEIELVRMGTHPDLFE